MLGSAGHHLTRVHTATLPAAAHSEDDANGVRVASMTKWEYITVPVLVHATKQILDNMGEDGWELVQVVPGLNPESLVAYFKRAKES
jgi:hypothetical protein